jgi:hypothetical protein
MSLNFKKMFPSYLNTFYKNIKCVYFSQAVNTVFKKLCYQPVFRVFGDYLKCFKCFNNTIVQGNKTNIMFEGYK